MAYNATYTDADLDDIAIDAGGTFLVAWIPFMTIVALVVIVGYLFTQLRKARKAM